MQDFIVFIQQHSTLALLLVVILISLSILEFFRLRKKGQQLTPSQATQLINHQNALVVDLRSAEQYAKGHIIDSLSLPYAEFKEKSKKLEKMKNRPLILVCAKGFDSPKVAASLSDQGYHVHTLGGGIDSWIHADLPLLK